MRSREEWQKELHRRTRDFREERAGGGGFYKKFIELPTFSFWQGQLDGGSTWLDKHQVPHPVSELDDEYLVNIWNYMVREQEFLSLVWVSSFSDPAQAHRELAEDWLENTPIMSSLFWEMNCRGLKGDSITPLDYSDLPTPEYQRSWEDMVE